MKHRAIQYILILLTIAGITAGYFYYRSNAAQKINASKVNNLTSGLVGYWTFDGADMNATTALDMSTNDNAGTINGTVTKVPGKVGQALNLDGSTGYIDLSAQTTNPSTTANWTLSLWFKIDQLSSVKGPDQVLYSQRNGTGTGRSWMYLRASDDQLCSVFMWSGNDSCSSTTPVVNNWYHAVLVKTGSATFQWYINSVAGSANTGVTFDSATGGHVMGAAKTLAGGFLDGQMDEPRLYNRALSQSEITELYQQGQTKINASQTNKLTNGLVGYWTFDGADTSWSGDVATVSNKGSVGASANGTSSGMSKATSPTIGKTGQALNFDGSDDYIDAGTPNLGITDITECAWIYPKAVTGNHIIMQYTNTTDGDNLLFRIGNYGDGKIDFVDGNGTMTFSNSTLSVNAWYHVCATLSIVPGIANDISKLYINGSLDNSITNYDYNPSVGSSVMRIGANAAGSALFNGSIDETRIYDRALSASEITELYQQGQTKINASEDGKLESGLIAYYTMDGADTNWTGATTGTVADRSPGGTNTGTLTNMSQSTSPVIGKIGQAMNFVEASSNYIVKTAASGLPEENNQFTISAWINYPTNIGGGGRAIVNFAKDPGGNYGNLFGVASNKLKHWFDDSSFLAANTTLSYNTWHHAVVTYDGTNRRIYLNGSPDGNDTPPAQTLSGITDLYVGYYWANSTYINSQIDEVRIYNRALSASEVTELYNMGR